MTCSNSNDCRGICLQRNDSFARRSQTNVELILASMLNILTKVAAVFLLLLHGGGLSSVEAQEVPEPSGFLRNYIGKVLGKSADPVDAKFISYPTLAYTPETSLELGISSLYVYSAKRDLSNRLSEMKSFTFYTLENQYGFWLYHAIYTDQNEWFLYGRARYQRFPLFYYGIGRESPSEVQSVHRRAVHFTQRTRAEGDVAVVVRRIGIGLPAIESSRICECNGRFYTARHWHGRIE